MTSVLVCVVRVRRPGSKADCSTTCAGQPPATWIAPACPGTSPCRSPAIRPRRCTALNIVSEQDIRAALVKTQTYLDTRTTRSSDTPGLRRVSITPLCLTSDLWSACTRAL